MLELMRLMAGTRRSRYWPLSLGLLATLTACQPQHDQAQTANVPPVGHYEGSISPAGQPEMRAALDIRHPSPGHYEAELSVPTAGSLSFVADTILFSNDKLSITRPAQPSQTLTLTLEGDFWRGSLTLDSAQAPALLLKRGAPSPSTYRVEELPQRNGTAWLFSPADTGTPGAALALLPETSTASSTALWADALAREGIIVLVLPAVDSAAVADEAPRLQAALRLLHGTAGADTASIGVWASGTRATAVAQALTVSDGPRATFFIAQNTELDADGRAAFRELKQRKVPLLGLFGGNNANQKAAALQNAIGGRRGAAVHVYRTTGADLLLSGQLIPCFGPGLPGDVTEWLRAR